ncbi:MAG: Por secretion system protein, partial [Balneolaceae bacterium]
PDDIRAQWLLNADPDAESPFLLRDIQVTAMAVNGANQKWIGTENEGIFLLNEEGNTILNQFTRDNSPLLSNSIQSMAVDPETGELFISTDVGLISFLDIPRRAEPVMDKLKVFPNPFVYDRHDRIFIDGMTEQSRIRILGANGTLIQTIDARGARVEWNARDFEGNRLGSGVYLVVALDENNSERGVGKVVIIR